MPLSSNPSERTLSFAQQLRHRIAQAWQGFATPGAQTPAVPRVIEPAPENPPAPPVDLAVQLAREALAQIQQAANDLDRPADPARTRRVARTLREHGVRLASALTALEPESAQAATQRGKAPSASVSRRLAAAVIRSAAVPRTPSADDQPTPTRR